MQQDSEKKQLNNLEDIEIVNSIVAGNKNDFQKIVKKYKRIISSVVRRTIRNPIEAEDLVQESFIKAYNAIQSYNQVYNFSSWLVRIATNHCIDYLRKKKMETISLSGKNLDDESDYELDFPDENTLPDDELINSETIRVINKSINELPENYKNIIRLRFIDELDYTEISKVLNIPLGTVKATIFRSRKLLQAILRKNKIYNDSNLN
ncbi:MAG: hypothetical protein A2X64_05805 [Ignavibacteria bacterium GWF2_33_9]|nr:MAG: hypothetical protein A2X64_05805 [Ignavibacteria bacterium GWF2_33_9]